MNISTRNLVQYKGIDNLQHRNIINFNQLSINHTFSLPMEKPKIKEILKVSAKAKVVNEKVVLTPIGKSIEGQMLTGNKSIITGDIEYKLEYIADIPEETICTAQCKIPFSGYVALPKNIKSKNSITTSSFIEDIYSEKLDNESVYNNFITLLIADVF